MYMFSIPGRVGLVLLSTEDRPAQRRSFAKDCARPEVIGPFVVGGFPPCPTLSTTTPTEWRCQALNSPYAKSGTGPLLPPILSDG